MARTHTKSNFLLIEHGGMRKQFTLQTLKTKNLNVYIACSSPPDWISTYLPASHIIVTDTYNSIKLVADVVAFMAANNITFSAVGTFYEHTVIQTADLASALKLPGLNPGAARRSSCNKLLMRFFCKKAGMPTPKFAVVTGFAKKSFAAGIKQVGLPCVIKPVFGAESYGTIKVESGYHLDRLISEIKLNTSADKKEVFKNFTGTFLVEEYLSGPVVSVDGLVQNSKIFILGSVEFIMGPEPRFTQEANFIPSRLPEATTQKCFLMTEKIIAALGFDNCGFHCELRITPTGPILLEIAARLPGGPLQPGYKKALGLDLTSEVVDIWLGKNISPKPVTQKYVLQKAVFPRERGVISHIAGLNQIKKISSLWDFTQISHLHEKTIIYPHIPKPYYYYALVANSPKELETISQELESTLKFRLKK